MEFVQPIKILLDFYLHAMEIASVIGRSFLERERRKKNIPHVVGLFCASSKPIGDATIIEEVHRVKCDENITIPGTIHKRACKYDT